jgi:glycoside/pentoside/hexuronide:cation symporter, GPH family
LNYGHAIRSDYAAGETQMNAIAPAIGAPPASHVSLGLKISHGIGSMAYGVKDNGFSVFLLIFYNQALGIDAAVAGAIIMAALICDAFIDPIIGELSDRTQSRWGRRLPWLYSAAIPLGFAWYALWHPPLGDPTMALIWLFVTAVIMRALIAACEVPSIALVPELTSDYDERTRLMRYRFLFAWATGLAMLMLAYGVFLNGPGGVTNPSGYHGFAICGAVLMTASVLISAFLQHKTIAYQSPPPQASESVTHVMRQMHQTLNNSAFLWLMSAALFNLINQSMTFALTNYLLVYLWQLSTPEMLAYSLVLFGSVIISFIMAPMLSVKLGKKHAVMTCAFMSVLFNAILYGSWLLNLVPGGASAPSIYFLFPLIGVAYSFGITTMILTSSMIADVVEASEHVTGRRSEGLFYAGFFFTQKCAIGIGTFAAGLILRAASFPDKAIAGQVSMAALTSMATYYLATFILCGFIGIAVVRNYPISRADHEARIKALSGDG